MAEITAALVKELREVSGAGMMDCKKALVENNGDMEASVDWLRKKGLAAAAKKSGRVAAEGLVGVIAEGKQGALVELNCETDFVARNEQFQGFVAGVTKLALGSGDVDVLKDQKLPGEGHSVAEKLTQLVATIGENMLLRRAAKVSVSDGVVVAYMHNSIASNLGKIGVLVGLESTGDKAKLAALGKQIAMHVAATNPQALTIDAVDPAALERERAVLAEQAKASGKPAEIIGKMVEGRLRKFYEEVVLLEQAFVMDPDSRVKQVVEKAAKELGAPVSIVGYVRMALGEGIDKEQKDAA
ncbi:MAG TPA: translation elongation factor Ts [Alphaproteobacteria bacterium]|nr:translation elongation factor Ts [Alphaproteobacteria bacterium]